MSWESSLFIDTTLPFGLRSAPKIFTAVADAAEWIAKLQGVTTILHYLDDFLVIGNPESTECMANVALVLTTFDHLGIPAAMDKLEGPCSVLTFLGIELDTVQGIIRLPAQKLQELRHEIATWVGKKSCWKRDLESLVGKLQHASKVVKPGRTFLRRMFELLRGVVKKHHHIRLNHAFRLDLMRWHTFLEAWNGKAMMRTQDQWSPAVEVFTDASGEVGCGALWGTHWLQLKWANMPNWRNTPITQKEVLPAVLACAVWGHRWKAKQVQLYCDNEAAVAVLNTGYSHDSLIMHLLRALFFVKAHFDLDVRVTHIPGRVNGVADASSRDDLASSYYVLSGTNSVTDPITNPPGCVSSSSGGSARLDISGLGAVVCKLFSGGLATSTLKSYRSCANRYTQFCVKGGFSPFPVSEQVICLFMAFLYQEGLAGTSAKSYLAALRYTQIAMGLGDPHMSEWPKLGYVIRGFKKRATAKQRPRLPITPVILRQLKRVWEAMEDSFNGRMLWAAACMCFFGFLRTGEVVVPSESLYDAETHLSVGDVRLDSQDKPTCLLVQIKASKTDVFRKGNTVYLGITGTELCPVVAIVNYMILPRGQARTTAFFGFSDGRPLTRDLFVRELRTALTAVGIEAEKFAGHSFRIGAATTAATCGMPDSLIQTLGRWRAQPTPSTLEPHLQSYAQ